MRCIRIRTDGTLEEVDCNRENLHEIMGGALTFVGALPESNIVALGLEAPEPTVNTFPFPSDTFDLPIRGDVVLVKTDEFGYDVNIVLTDMPMIRKLQ
jgi:hypothetical protein